MSISKIDQCNKLWVESKKRRSKIGSLSSRCASLNQEAKLQYSKARLDMSVQGGITPLTDGSYVLPVFISKMQTPINSSHQHQLFKQHGQQLGKSVNDGKIYNEKADDQLDVLYIPCGERSDD